MLGIPAEARSAFSRHAVALVSVLVTFGGLIALALFTTTRREWGSAVMFSAASFAVGALLGFLIGGPGVGAGEKAAADASAKGWGARLGVFSTWLTGAAFALALKEWSALAEWFANVTRTATEASSGAPRRSAQYGLAAAMVTAVCGGFIFGFMQMATNGRRLFERGESDEQ